MAPPGFTVVRAVAVETSEDGGANLPHKGYYHQYLDSGKNSDGLNKNEKRDIRKKCKPFCAKYGHLIYIRIINNEVQLRQVLMKTEVSRVIKACHEGFGGAHVEWDKTTENILATHYFKGIKEPVSDYVFKLTSARERLINQRCRLQSYIPRRFKEKFGLR